MAVARFGVVGLRHRHMKQNKQGKLLKLRQQRDADGVSPLLLSDSGPLFPLRATFSFIP